MPAAVGREQTVHHGRQRRIQRVERRAIGAHRNTDIAGPAPEQRAVSDASAAIIIVRDIETGGPEDDKVQPQWVCPTMLDRCVELQGERSAGADLDYLTGEIRRIK